MKKTVMTAAVLGFAASIVSAQVYSQNIVGYAKLPEPTSGLDIVSPQFWTVSGETTLGDAFSGLADESLLYIWNGVNGYDPYRYYVGWGWYHDVSGDESNDLSVGAGVAVWLVGGGSDAMMAGEVPSSSSITNVLGDGLNMVANPYPVALALGDIPTETLSDEDLMWVWNGVNGYDPYRYYVGWGWYHDVSGDDSNAVEIPIGKGFWMNVSAGGNMVFNKPF